MAFKFQPLGIPVSSSYAISASAALFSVPMPPTASYAEYVLTVVGPSGSAYKTVSGSVT